MNEKLAKEIVSRTMSIIPYNVNVMDKDGIIIGSGDEGRLGDEHHGALKVLQSGGNVVFTEQDSKKYKRTKQGVNLPIFFHKELIGVIGITGDPDVVAPFGELVKMAAELTIEQAYLFDQMRWNETLKQETLIQLLKGEAILTQEFSERAQRLNINLNIERQAVIFYVPEDTDLKERQRFTKELEHLSGINDLLVTTSATEIVLLKESRSLDPSAFSSMFNQLLKKMNLGIYGALGYLFEGLYGASLSYESAKETLAAAKKLQSTKCFFSYNEWALPVLLIGKKDEKKHEHFKKMMITLKRSDRSGELLHTLLSFIKLNEDMNKTAEELYIHRNTLRYRLDKIEEITHYDPRKTLDLMTLYAAILIDADD
ncbi:sugar diacid recognition domain-containing protein [Metabacillus idriensis]|uniref:sugar diacid recognition domain-containing protein n=1 Tax=Metabacillus idriensis TaxID=324768 RepID=UPI00174D650D|nr:sugar diacid recognition domain-containing protein [Metabacillus idriensis]